MPSRAGLSVDGVFNLTNIDRWFPAQIEELVRLEEKVAEWDYWPQRRPSCVSHASAGLPMRVWRKLAGVREAEIRNRATSMTCIRVYKRVDTCAAEFATDTASHVPTYEDECEANPSIDRDKPWSRRRPGTVSASKH